MFLHDNYSNVSEAQRSLNKAAFSLDGCQQIRQVIESMPRQPSHPINGDRRMFGPVDARVPLMSRHRVTVAFC